MADVCGIEFTNFFNGTIMPLVAYASIVTTIIIALSFMVGRTIANAKLTLWARTEIVQLVISLSSVLLIMAALSSFCLIDVSEMASLFGTTDPGSANIYDAAELYLKDAALYSHNAMTAVRYHLEGYTILSYLNAFICDFATGRIGWGCLFGWSGTNQQPLGGYGAQMAALNIFFNSTMISHFSALNFLFVLIYVYRGFVFIFLPLGIFLRSMPYMRSFGALLIAVALSFMIVYPFMLSVYYLMGSVLVDKPNYYPTVEGTSMSNFIGSKEKVFPDNAGGDSGLEQSIMGESHIRDTYFPNKDNLSGVIMFASYAFVAAVFLPTVALLATIASVSYIARLYGEEIDLSKIVQMV
jgi:hypothetical protein